MFQAVTLHSEAPINLGQCARGGNVVWPLMRAMTKIPAATVTTHTLRKVHTGISTSASLISGQVSSPAQREREQHGQVERGRVWQ